MSNKPHTAIFSYNPANGFPRIMPSLRYTNVKDAISWLHRVFGFTEHLIWKDKNDVILHAEMRIDNAYIEMSQAPQGYQKPNASDATYQSLLIIFVDDVDSHYQRAKKEGAHIIAEPEDKRWGLRQYTVEDLEGHRFEFSQYLRDVPPQEWGAKVME